MNEYICEVITGNRSRSQILPGDEISVKGKKVIYTGDEKSYDLYNITEKGGNVVDALEHLTLISEIKESWDRDGADWNQEMFLTSLKKSQIQNLRSLASVARIIASDSDDEEEESNNSKSQNSKNHKVMTELESDERELRNYPSLRSVTDRESESNFETMQPQETKTDNAPTMKKEHEPGRTSLLMNDVSNQTNLKKEEKMEETHHANALERNTNAEKKAIGDATMTTGISLLEKYNLESSTSKVTKQVTFGLSGNAGHDAHNTHNHSHIELTSRTIEITSVDVNNRVLTKSDLYKMREDTTARLNGVKPADMRNIACCSNRSRQVIFSALLFLHSFMYGWFLLVNIREVFNITKYYGSIPSTECIASLNGEIQNWHWNYTSGCYSDQYRGGFTWDGDGWGSTSSSSSTTDNNNQGGFDRVLCDTVCSGDGTFRKLPDLWTKWTVRVIMFRFSCCPS